MEFSNNLHEAKRKAWEELASTLNYNSNLTKVMNIIKSINKQLIGALKNGILHLSHNKILTTDEEKPIYSEKHIYLLLKN